MTDLPENKDDWPYDCFELLGVPKSTNRKELRRAYFRLIKKYRPDSHPEAFQRIHQAHEAAQGRLERALNRGKDLETSIEPETTSQQIQTTDTNNRNRSPRDPSNSPPLTSAAKTPVSPDQSLINRFWELASKGLWEETANTIPKIQNLRDRNRAGFSQYFLQRACADRHATTQCEARINILLQYMKLPKFRQECLFYLANEFENQPELAKLNCVENLIATSSSQTYAHELARLRWKAVGIAEPQVVVSDMSRFREHFSDQVAHSAAEALEYTTWLHSPEFKEHNDACHQMVNDSAPWLADESDLLSLSATEMSGETITLWDAGDISCLVPHARTGFTSEMKNKWRPMVSGINQNRSQTLKRLKPLTVQFPISMSIFCSGLRRFAEHELNYSFFDFPSKSCLKKEVSAYLMRLEAIDFEKKHRLTTAEFCIENLISPVTFGQVLDGFTKSNLENLLWQEVFQKDTAFNCIYYAGLADQI